jgi:hypothetical protein
MTEYRTSDEAQAAYEAKFRKYEGFQQRTAEEAVADGVDPQDLQRGIRHLQHLYGATKPHDPSCPRCAEKPDDRAMAWAHRSLMETPANAAMLVRRGVCLLGGEEPVDHLTLWRTDADGIAYGVCEGHQEAVVIADQREARNNRRLVEHHASLVARTRDPGAPPYDPPGECLLCGAEERPLAEYLSDAEGFARGVCAVCYGCYLAGGGPVSDDGGVHMPDPATHPSLLGEFVELPTDGAPAEG